MANQLAYSDRDSSGHIPSAHNFSRSGDSSHAAAFPAVSKLFSGSMPAAYTRQDIIQKQENNPSGVAQLDKDLLLLLTLILAALTSFPELLTITAFSVGVTALMAWLDHKKKQMKIEEITPLCNRLQVDPQRLINRLNQDEDDLSETERNDFLGAFFEHKSTKHSTQELPKHGLIPPKLIEHLYGNDEQKFNMLFTRFNNYSFNYTGTSQTAIEGFINRRGDCRTLVNMLKLSADAADIKGVQVVDSNTREMLVEEHSIHGRDTRGNVEGLLCWYFDEHHWCTLSGQRYDALFKIKAAPQTSYRTKILMYKGVSYFVFDNGRCMIKSEEAESKMGMNLNGKMGIVKENKKEVHEFIVQHRRNTNELEW
jgi:hypothetical protein